MQETRIQSLVGKISQRRKWQPTPVFLPRESYGQRSLLGWCLWGLTELETTEMTKQQQQQNLSYPHRRSRDQHSAGGHSREVRWTVTPSEGKDSESNDSRKTFIILIF